MMPQEEKKHKRRVHYSGKYPKKFEEKYKEHQPEKYQDMICLLYTSPSPRDSH